MKHFIVFAGLVLAVVLADTVKSSYNKVHKTCQKDEETFVEETIFEKLKRNEKVDLPANFGLHAFCMLEKLEIQDSQGRIKQDGIRKAVQEGASDSSKVNQIITECSVNKATKEETALGLFRCFGKNNVDIGQF